MRCEKTAHGGAAASGLALLWGIWVVASMIGGCDDTAASADDAGVPMGGASEAGGHGGSSMDGGVHPGGASDWCGARLVLRDNCTVCHGVPPAIGAPISLVTIDDLWLWSQNSGKYVYDLVKERIHDVALPMPPLAWKDPLTAAEMETLDVWIAGGAQPAECNSGVDVAPP